MDRESADIIAVLESSVDQEIAKWDRRLRGATSKISSEEIARTIIATFRSMKASDSPEVRLIQELAEIGWNHILIRLGHSISEEESSE
jgi:hypothetical protein